MFMFWFPGVKLACVDQHVQIIDRVDIAPFRQDADAEPQLRGFLVGEDQHTIGGPWDFAKKRRRSLLEPD